MPEISEIVKYLGIETTGKRLGWNVEPDDDTDLAWKDVEGEPEIEVEGELTAHDFEYNGETHTTILIANLPVDPETVVLPSRSDSSSDEEEVAARALPFARRRRLMRGVAALGRKALAHQAGSHDQQSHAGGYPAVSKMTRKDMLAELAGIHGYKGPTSYTKEKLGAILEEQRKKTGPLGGGGSTTGSGDKPWEKSATFQSMPAKDQKAYEDYVAKGGKEYPYGWSQQGKPTSDGIDLGGGKTGKIKPEVDTSLKSVGEGRGKTFESRSAADAYGKKHWGKHQQDSSPEVLEGVRGYQSGSAALNGGLRTGNPLGDTARMRRNGMDTFIETGPRVPEDLVVYRGFGTYSTVLTQKQGTRFTDPGFVSTSLNHKKAADFGSYDPGSGGTIIAEIKVPKGAKAGFVTGISPSFQGNSSESELVLPRSSQFKIIGSRPWKGMTVIELELEP